MSIQGYIGQKKEIQKSLLSLFTSDQNSESVNIESFINIVKDQKILQNEKEFRSLLHLICSVSNNHHRSPNFNNIIEKILLSFKDDFKKYLNNREIYYIFSENKRILLMLHENKIFEFDDKISHIIKNKRGSENFLRYFINEVKPFLDTEYIEQIIKEKKVDNDDSEYFEQNRKIGENESKICEIVRNDSIDDFIVFINQNHVPLTMKITPSIFETNQFLTKNEPTLIEYSAFFGSIQIFKYLKINKVEINSKIWIYAIHGRNPEIISILEESHIEPDDISYQKVYEESILCHHNEISEYIKDKLLNDNDENNYYKIIGSYNYEYFPDELYLDKNVFYSFCIYDHFYLVCLMLDYIIDDVEYQVHEIENDYETFCTPLLGAALYNNINIVKLLINRPEVDINTIGIQTTKTGVQNEMNLLRAAIINRNIELMEILLKNKKIDVNLKLIVKNCYNEELQSMVIEEVYPINIAVSYNYKEILDLLLKHNKLDVNARHRELMSFRNGIITQIYNQNSLITAFCINSNEAVKNLLSHPKIDVNAASTFKKDESSDIDFNFTENLLCFSIERKNYEITNLLLNRQNLDVNAKCICHKKDMFYEEKPALYLAIENGEEEIVKKILENKEIDVNCKYFCNDIVKNDSKEKSVLQFAIEKGNENIIKLLLSNSNIDANFKSRIKNQNNNKIVIDEQTTLSYAINNGNVEIIKLLLSNEDINIKLKDRKVIKNQTFNECKIEEKNLLEIASEKAPQVFQFLLDHLKQLYNSSEDNQLKKIISKFS